MRVITYLIAIYLLFVSCVSKPKEIEKTIFSLDTYIRIIMICEDKQKSQKIFDSLEQETNRINNLFNRYSQSSEVYRINNTNSTTEFKINHEVAKLVAISNNVSMQTQGAFDISIGPIKDLWGFGTGLTQKVPSPKELDSVLLLVDYKNISVDTNKNTIKFSKPKVQIDLGGIAKGYVLKRLGDIILSFGINYFLVEAGGDIYAHGRKHDNSRWVVGLMHPRNKNKLYAKFTLKDNVSVVTSGDYERFFMVGNKRYHHIFSSKTGYPAKNCVSVSILAKDPTIADAFSTAIFVMPPSEGIKLLNKNKDIEGLIISNKDDSLRYYISDNFKNMADVEIQ